MWLISQSIAATTLRHATCPVPRRQPAPIFGAGPGQSTVLSYSRGHAFSTYWSRTPASLSALVGRFESFFIVSIQLTAVVDQIAGVCALNLAPGRHKFETAREIESMHRGL